jgi:large subunit ribosomal protein L24
MKKKLNIQKRFAPKLHIKKGDKVMVMAGDDKGKTGSVLQVIPHKNLAVVEDVNLAKKHMKPSNEKPEGGIHEIAVPVHISNLMLIDPKTGNPTRIGRKLVDGKNMRYSKSSGEII